MGMSSFLCPICELPIMASISIGTRLSHVTLVKPNGDMFFGTYDGYARLETANDTIDLWPLIQYEDSWDEGWGDGDGIIVHQACVSKAEEMIRNGTGFPKMQSDLGQGHFYSQWQVDEFLAQFEKINDLKGYSPMFHESNVFAKIDKDDYGECNGSLCPVCESGMIECDFIEVNAGRAYQDISCLTCHSSWTDVYKLETYDNLTVSDKAKEMPEKEAPAKPSEDKISAEDKAYYEALEEEEARDKAEYLRGEGEYADDES